MKLTPKNFQLKDISKWYHSMNVPCPFLTGNVCAIYNQRPMVCQEHLVVNSAPDCCNPDKTKQPQILKPPVSIAEALAELTSRLEQKPAEAILLPFVFAWCDENYEYFEHTWPASELVSRFIKIISSQNKELSPLPVARTKT